MTMSLFSAVRAELDDPLTPVLAVGAAASAVLGSGVDALLVSGALGMNAVVGGVQRLCAERALAELSVGQRQTARRVTDARAGTTAVVDAARLVPGDVVELTTGDVVPADARLLEAADLEVDESALTGESLPARKQVAATPGAVVADRSCMVYEGTTVVAGCGRAVVVGTGDRTQAGRAASLASRAPAAGGVQARLQELTKKVLPLTKPSAGEWRWPWPPSRKASRWWRRSRRWPPPAGSVGAGSWSVPPAPWRRWAGSTPSASTRPAP